MQSRSSFSLKNFLRHLYFIFIDLLALLVKLTFMSFDLSMLTLQNVLAWLAFGLIAGLIVHLIDRSTTKGGIAATVFTGIIGALFGGILAEAVLGLRVTGFNLQSLIVAVAGALILAVLQRAIFRQTGHIKTPTERIE